MAKSITLDNLLTVQLTLENAYDLETGLDVRDFVLPENNFKELGKLEVVQKTSPQNDLDLALIFDRDILSAFTGDLSADDDFQHRATSVVFEEISHFVYLAYNHNRGQNVTRLEMEIQSEVDRIILAFDERIAVPDNIRESLWLEFMEKNYLQPQYEEARRAALRFTRGLKSENPAAWSRCEKERLLRFFHGDLSQKLFLASPKKNKP